MDQAIFDQLLNQATIIRPRAHTPISNFKVSAVIRTDSGNYYSGVNIEDPAFNSTIHAEQCAIANMITNEGKQKITHLITMGGLPDDDLACTPCGHCRQMLVEFAPDSLQIVVVDTNGKLKLKTSLGELLPYAFRLNNFQK